MKAHNDKDWEKNAADIYVCLVNETMPFISENTVSCVSNHRWENIIDIYIDCITTGAKKEEIR